MEDGRQDRPARKPIETLEDLVHHERLNRGHVLFDRGNLTLWMRKLTNRSYPVLLDISTVDARRERTGSFTRFLDAYEKLGFFVETVGNGHLARFLERRGYLRASVGLTFDDIAPSFYKPTDYAGMDDHLRSLAAKLREQRNRPFGAFAP